MMAQAIRIDSPTKVYFIHGGGSTDTTDQSLGSFPVYLRSTLGDRFHMEVVRRTSDFEQVLAIHARAIFEFQPDIVIGKSQGGPTILHLIQRGIWRGCSILCCPAIIGSIDPLDLPSDVPFTIVVGRQDEQVPFDRITLQFVEPNQKRLGDRLHVVVTEDMHSLRSCVRSKDESPAASLTVLIEEIGKRRVQMEAEHGYDHAKRIGTIPAISIPPSMSNVKKATTKCSIQ